MVVEGSTLSNSDWYNVSNVYKYTNLSNTEGYVITGYHPYIRLSFTSSLGSISNILAR